jgi:hypothetical protein
VVYYAIENLTRKYKLYLNAQNKFSSKDIKFVLSSEGEFNLIGKYK